MRKIRFLLIVILLVGILFHSHFASFLQQSAASMENRWIALAQNLNGNERLLALAESVLSFLKKWGIDPLDGRTLDQQVNQVVDAIGQQIGDQRLLHGLHIRRLPFEERQGNGKVTVENISVSAGDPGVSASQVHSAARLIQNLSLPVLRQNVAAPDEPVRVVLFSTRSAYAQALEHAGIQSNLVQAIVDKTGGITVGSDVWIPLYALSSDGDLANVLTHELTHVVLNQKGIGEKIPDWVNEGIAWHDGMLAWQEIQPQKAKWQAAMMNRQIQLVAQRGELLPLTVDEEGILHASYNVEWEDYLAVEHLLQQGGGEKFRAFLNDAAKDGAEASFLAQYNVPLRTYEESFYQSLKKE
jgi:hypothetical protein